MVKNDKLDALIMLSGDVLIQRNLEIFKSTDTSNIIRPKSLDRRVNRTIDKEHRIKEYGYLFKPVKAFVAAILIVCTISFAAIMSVDAVRESLWNAIVNFYKDFFEVVFVKQEDAPETLEEKREPTLISEDWEKQVLTDGLYTYSIKYRHGGIVVLRYTQFIQEAEAQLGDNEYTNIEDVAIGGFDGIFVKYTDKTRIGLKWTDREYSYFVTANSEIITAEQLVKIAESVYNDQLIPELKE